MPNLDAGERRLSDGTAVTIAGRGPAIVLLHGVGLDRTMWTAQVHAMAGRRTVVSCDLLGHGRSPRLRTGAELGVFTGQLARLFTELAIERADVLGFSFGGLIAQAFALGHPDKVAKLMIVASVFDRSAEERAAVEARLAKAQKEGPGAIVPAAIARWFSPALVAGQPEVIGEIERRLAANDPASFLAAYALFASADRELAGRIEHIACPTLVMTGELDSGSTPAMARAMANAIPGARCAIVAGARHMMPLEQADEVNRLLLAFLDG